MSECKYSLGYKFYGLAHNESIKMLELYLNVNDWKKTRDEAVERNLLQNKTYECMKRSCSEIIRRLKCLTKNELLFLHKSNYQDQSLVLWLAVCRRYRFIAEFAFEVLREKFLSGANYLESSDFNTFFNNKVECHPELENISTRTRSQAKTALFKMLRESELIDSDNNIVSPYFCPELTELIYNNNKFEFSYFPVSERSLMWVSNNKWVSGNG